MTVKLANKRLNTEWMAKIQTLSPSGDAPADKSKQLIEIAKTGVDRAIKADEVTAMTWMNQQLKVLEVNIS